jgi:hypothetical protein
MTGTAPAFAADFPYGHLRGNDMATDPTNSEAKGPPIAVSGDEAAAGAEDARDSEFSRTFGERAISDLERRARLTANPLYIWQAILRCFVHDLPLTDYCLNYIKSTAMLLHPLIEDAMSTQPQIEADDAIGRLAAALQISGRQGKPNAFIALRRNRDHEIDAAREVAIALGITAVKHRVSERRQMQRRIAEGRKLLGWHYPKRAKPIPQQ